MDKTLYELVKKVNERIKTDPKFAPEIRGRVREMLRFKRTSIMSWYVIYLKGVCDILEMHDLDEYKPVLEVRDVPVHHAITPQEVAVMTNRSVGYVNYYDLDETKFITGLLLEREFNNKKTRRIVEYGRTVWFVEDVELPNYKIGTIPDGADFEEVIEEEPTEKIG